MSSTIEPGYGENSGPMLILVLLNAILFGVTVMLTIRWQIRSIALPLLALESAQTALAFFAMYYCLILQYGTGLKRDWIERVLICLTTIITSLVHGHCIFFPREPHRLWLKTIIGILGGAALITGISTTITRHFITCIIWLSTSALGSLSLVFLGPPYLTIRLIPSILFLIALAISAPLFTHLLPTLILISKLHTVALLQTKPALQTLPITIALGSPRDEEERDPGLFTTSPNLEFTRTGIFDTHAETTFHLEPK